MGDSDIAYSEDILEDILDPDYQGEFYTAEEYDNNEFLNFFLEVNDLGDYVIEDDGTLIELSVDGETIFLECCGLGDFFSHTVYRSPDDN